MFKKNPKKSHPEANVDSNGKDNTQRSDHGPQQDRLIPLTAWPKFHPWPPIGGLRHIRFHAEEKGAAECFVKRGGRVLIREGRFIEWASGNDGA